MVNFLKKTAAENDIPWQPEILPAGGTDTAALQRYGKKGAIAGAISIPLRHIHQTIELANKRDIHNCIMLLKAALLHLNQYDWRFEHTRMEEKKKGDDVFGFL